MVVKINIFDGGDFHNVLRNEVCESVTRTGLQRPTSDDGGLACPLSPLLKPLLRIL